MDNRTTKPRLSSSPSIVWVVAQQMVETVRSPAMPFGILLLLHYFFVVFTMRIPYNDLALVSVRLARCLTSALVVGSLLNWLICLPDSHIQAPIPTLTRDEVDYLKGGIEEVFKERLSEMSVDVDQIGIQYRIHGGDLTGSAQKALGPQSMLRAKQIKDSLQEKRLVLSQSGEILDLWSGILLILCFLNLGLSMITLVFAVPVLFLLGFSLATYKHLEINLLTYFSFSHFPLIWSYLFFFAIRPGSHRTRPGDSVLDFYKVNRTFTIP